MGVFKRGATWHIRYVRDGTIVRESTGAASKKLAKAILEKRKTEVAEGKLLDKQERPEMTFAAVRVVLGPPRTAEEIEWRSGQAEKAQIIFREYAALENHSGVGERVPAVTDSARPGF